MTTPGTPPGELADRLEAATAGMTPGPWFGPMDGVIASHPSRDPDAEWTLAIAYSSRETSPEDAAGIVALRNALPDILRALRAVPAAPQSLDVERLRTALQQASAYIETPGHGRTEARVMHRYVPVTAEAVAAEYSDLAPSAGSSGTRITHGRHCMCTPCTNEDWTNPNLAHCGMHGPSCPPRYQPLGIAGQSAEQPSHPAAPSIGEAE